MIRCGLGHFRTNKSYFYLNRTSYFALSCVWSVDSCINWVPSNISFVKMYSELVWFIPRALISSSKATVANVIVLSLQNNCFRDGSKIKYQIKLGDEFSKRTSIWQLFWSTKWSNLELRNCEQNQIDGLWKMWYLLKVRNVSLTSLNIIK